MRRIVLSVFLAVCFSFAFSDAVITASPDIFGELREKAIDNISSMPEAKEKEYLDLLNTYNDLFMAFFLASEESSKLLLAERDDLISHYHRVRELHESYRDRYSLPFFLSYIAKITVTDERITPYHEHFQRYGLLDLKKVDEESLVRELNLWCRKYMTFQPTSGRDMTPYDILEKTNIGRCEEMQIFFISAARSLGIPSRPAMTPLWAHTDNNHAWVEVFVNDKWRYLGAVEPAYDLDDAWFSANLPRAVMIMSTSSFPDSTDIVLETDRYQAKVNSTPNYDSGEFRAREIRITTKDERGRIIPGVKIGILVYNWGMLRPIFRTETDEGGEAALVTGSSSFIISAAKDSLFALYEVPAQKNKESLNKTTRDTYQAELLLGSSPVFSLSSVLEFPGAAIESRRERPDWNEYRDTFSDKYNEIVSSYQDLVSPFGESDSLLNDVWRKCRNNKDVYQSFYEKNKPIADDFLKLLTLIDEKFLWQADISQWQMLHDFYLEMIGLEYSDELKANILSPTVLFEELPQKSLKESLTNWRRGDVEERIEKIMTFLSDSYLIDNDRAVLSLLPYDKTMDLISLTNYQYKMLACSVLRANHIPASYTRIPDMIIIYLDNSWRYYDLKDKSFQRSEPDGEGKDLFPVVIKAVDEYGYPIKLSKNQYNLTFLQDGVFYPYERQPEYETDSALTIDLEPGTYQIQIGYRLGNEKTRIYLESIDTTPALRASEFLKDGQEPGRDYLELIIQLEEYPRQWEKLTEELTGLLTMLRLMSRENDDPLLIILGDYDNEPVRRLSDRIRRDFPENDFTWLGTKSSPEHISTYRVSNEYIKWLGDNQQMQNRVITLYFSSEEKNWYYYEGIWERLPD